jgi:hypothetical protein
MFRTELEITIGTRSILRLHFLVRAVASKGEKIAKQLGVAQFDREESLAEKIDFRVRY